MEILLLIVLAGLIIGLPIMFFKARAQRSQRRLNELEDVPFAVESSQGERLAEAANQYEHQKRIEQTDRFFGAK